MPVPLPPPLYPRWNTPKGDIPAIWAWRAYTNPAQSITSVINNERPLADIPAEIFGMVYYHQPPPGAEPLRRTLDYGSQDAGGGPYTFYLPDGSTRHTQANMSQQAYEQLAVNIWQNDVYPT